MKRNVLFVGVGVATFFIGFFAAVWFGGFSIPRMRTVYVEKCRKPTQVATASANWVPPSRLEGTRFAPKFNAVKGCFERYVTTKLVIDFQTNKIHTHGIQVCIGESSRPMGLLDRQIKPLAHYADYSDVMMPDH